MELTPVKPGDAGEGIVQIEPSTIQTIGVRTGAVEVGPLRRVVRSTGRFVMDERGAFTVTLKTSGWIEKLYVDYEGALVESGEPLLEIYSPELVATQEEYLLALKNAERMRGSALPSVAGDARRIVEAARRRLEYWGVSEDEILRLEQSRQPLRTVLFRVPASGEVMSKRVSEGQFVRAGEPLLDIFDLEKIWLIADVYEQDLAWVREGMKVSVQLPYEENRTYTGSVDHIYYMLKQETRTARARIVMQGQRQVLRPGMYATVVFETDPLEPTILVPEEAVIRTGARDVVIVSLGAGRFRPVPVKLGLTAEGHYQITEGLSGDEMIVTSAQFLIDSESRLKTAINAMIGGHTHDASAADQSDNARAAQPAGHVH
jgi:RND family efflux transporter MFP subunit